MSGINVARQCFSTGFQFAVFNLNITKLDYSEHLISHGVVCAHHHAFVFRNLSTSCQQTDTDTNTFFCNTCGKLNQFEGRASLQSRRMSGTDSETRYPNADRDHEREARDEKPLKDV